MDGISKFVGQPTGQDNQWADPSLASPLASMMQYVNGMNWYGSPNGSGDTGSSGTGPQNEIYTTNPYDKNVSGSDDANKSLQDALATARKYDPNAQLEYYDPYAGSEGGASQQMVRIKMDQSKLPKAPTGAALLSNLRTANNQTPNAGQGPHLYDQSYVFNDPNWGPMTSEKNINQNYGKNPYTDVGFWGPLAVSAVTAGAGMGMIPGFGGMTDAAAQGLVGSATGGMGAGDASFLGMTGNKLGNTFREVANATLGGQKPNTGNLLNTAAGIGLGMSGLTPGQQMLARWGMRLAGDRLPGGG